MKWRHTKKIICFLMLFMALNATTRADTDQSTQIKAAILVKLTYFVKWDAFLLDHPKKILLCIYGANYLYEKLDELSGLKLDSHEFVVKEVSVIDDDIDCHLIFFGKQDKKMTEVLAKINNKTIVTISDQLNFAEDGGIIQMKERNGKIRFVINLKRSNDLGIKLDSKLLALSNLIR